MKSKEKTFFSNLPELRSNSISLRPITFDDIDDIYEFASKPEVARFMLWEPHTSLTDTQDVINKIIDNYRKGEPAPWAIVHQEDKKVIGLLGFSYIHMNHRVAEIHFVISDAYWNRGYATEALETVINFGFHSLAINRIEGRCDPANAASEKVMKKAGMKYEGTLREQLFVKGHFADLKVFSILRREYAPDY